MKRKYVGDTCVAVIKLAEDNSGERLYYTFFKAIVTEDCGNTLEVLPLEKIKGVRMFKTIIKRGLLADNMSEAYEIALGISKDEIIHFENKITELERRVKKLNTLKDNLKEEK